VQYVTYTCVTDDGACGANAHRLTLLQPPKIGASPHSVTDVVYRLFAVGMLMFGGCARFDRQSIIRHGWECPILCKCQVGVHQVLSFKQVIDALAPEVPWATVCLGGLSPLPSPFLAT
jgi:hypothetical protein